MESWNGGMLEEWVRRMSEEIQRKNITRGHMKWRVWQDAKAYFRMTGESFRNFPFELKKDASRQLASVDSIRRNVAGGYGRRSLREYLHFPNIAWAAIAESVSGLHVDRAAEMIPDASLEELDALACKIENGLERRIESLQNKQEDRAWQDSFILREFNAVYGAGPDSESQNSTIP